MRKRCFKCGLTKRLDAFYVHPCMRDGHLNKCKECTKADNARHYHKKKMDSEWLKRERRRQVEKQMRMAAVYRARYPERWRARALLSGAVQRGRIIKPSYCQRCGKPCLPDGHHHDYSKPLEVEWLCRRCHVRADGRSRD